jgi:hypothetical protein
MQTTMSFDIQKCVKVVELQNKEKNSTGNLFYYTDMLLILQECRFVRQEKAEEFHHSRVYIYAVCRVTKTDNP